jgi:hypothetical protein
LIADARYIVSGASARLRDRRTLVVAPSPATTPASTVSAAAAAAAATGARCPAAEARYFFGGRTLGPLADVELNALALIKRLEPATLNCGMVDE